MTTLSPLRKLHAQAEAASTPLPRGPALVCPPPTGDEPAVELVDTFGDPDAERLALRRGAALLDRPDRATIVVTGADRIDFLNRMLTQELKGLRPFQSRRSFWLSRKGRIDADLRLIHLPDRSIVDVDVRAAGRTLRTLAGYIITEEAALSDETERFHRLSLHGPYGPAALRRITAHTDGAPLEDLAPGGVSMVTIAGASVVVDRCDTTGVPGLELLAPAEAVNAIYHQLLDASDGESATGARPIGFGAWNVARMEAGEASYYVDFGPESLPAESGAFETRVSLTKGCYLGQEIVARMHALGRPKQRLTALRFASQPLALPRPGDLVYANNSAGEDPVGVVTSAARLPSLSGAAVCFAQIRYAHSGAGSRLRVVSAGIDHDAEAQQQLASPGG